MESENLYKKGIIGSLAKKPNESTRIFITICVGIFFGVFLGVTFPSLPLTKLISVSPPEDFEIVGNQTTTNVTKSSTNSSKQNKTAVDVTKIWVPSNPKGAERLPPGIVASTTDFYPRRLWGNPSDFSENFTIMLFHYDGIISEWDNYEWSKRAIHFGARKQTKWWFAKRILHPDVVALYDYIFIWDEDLGLEHFDAEEYIKLVRKNGLEISQPGLEPSRSTTWEMTKRRGDREVHKETEEKPGWCSDPHLPPCAAFVEIMAPVFSREAWRCVWHLIQNDLVHGWGLDFALQKCVEPAHEKIGVVDAQWIVHQAIPSLGNQGQAEDGKAPWHGVRERCRREWGIFKNRLEKAEKSYYKSIGIDPSNFTSHR